jgi:phage shock protein PspC (stress-responsive transcriptional regulator)
MVRRLTRSRTEGKLAGVCAGLANYLDVDVVLVRTAWVILSVVPGAIIGGILAYIGAWLIMPEETELAVRPHGRRLTLSDSDRKLAGVCGGLAEYFNVDATMIRVIWVVLSILFGAVIGGVVAYLLAWIIMPRRHDVIYQPASATPQA